MPLPLVLYCGHGSLTRKFPAVLSDSLHFLDFSYVLALSCFPELHDLGPEAVPETFRYKQIWRIPVNGFV
jgi:hypothetical protein